MVRFEEKWRRHEERLERYVRVASGIRRVADSGELDTNGRGRFFSLQELVLSAVGCEDCLRIEDDWMKPVCMSDV